MEALSTVTSFAFNTQTFASTRFPVSGAAPLRRFEKQKLAVSVVRPSLFNVGGLAEEDDVLLTFFRERKANGDVISKTSDMFWQRKLMKFVDANADQLSDSSQEQELVTEGDNDGGFLKLSSTNEWVSGGNYAPTNNKAVSKAFQDDSERRKKLNFLSYEALKRELMLLSVGIGTACSSYCLVVFSWQAAVSYATGVLFSCLYLKLLYQHADNLSREMVSEIFTRRKTKRIGIRSEDIKENLEKTIKGSSIALSSPRLVIPAAIYAIWLLSHQHLANDFFEFQLVPAILGMFVYKAAALVQVYRDNEHLELVFPENGEGLE